MGHQTSLRLAVLATLALGATTVGAVPANASAPEPVSPVKASSTKLTKLPVPVSNPIPLREGQQASWFVQFEGQGAAAAARREGGGSSGTTAAKARIGQVKDLSGAALARARQADGNASSLFTVTNAMAGVGLRLDAAGAAAVAKAPGVVKVSRIIPKTTQNSNTSQLVKALNTWRFSGNTGKGVTVGVIDTGLDYTHADFGGKGSVAAYDAAKASSTVPTWLQGLPKRAKAKIVGGYDFVGDAYDAAAPAGDPATIPKPDNNPLDCDGHGSHVAGTAAGYGVTASGKTFKPKKLTKLTKKKLNAMRIGPGMAPQASIFALKVFGCEGSTDSVLPALDKALDPNSDGKFDDKLDIVNMSLGSDYGPVDDPENDMLDAITANGVLSVVSMGNSSDLVDVGGSPGNATSTLAVASSVDSYQLRDAIKVNGPAGVAGTASGQASIAYDWKSKPPVTGTVVALSAANADGCAPLSAADAAAVKGKVAWLTWDDNDETRACGSVGRAANVRAAGAIGALFTGGVDPFGAGITGDTDIPVFQLTPGSTQKLAPQVATGQLSVTFSGALLRSLPEYDKGLTDTISNFTSRGTHGSLGVVKPDVAAVGDTVASAGVGSGNEALVESGTSMAAPTTAGVAALVKAAHPKWSPLKVKAAIMNTARHDLYTGKGKTGLKYGPNRVGSGRIDAKAAVQTKLLAYVNGPDNPVSASFGVVPVPINGGPVTRTRELVIRNLSTKAQKVKLSYEGIVSSPGVSYSVSKSTVKVKAKRKAKVTVTMTVTPAALRHTIDPTQKTTQLDTPRQYLSDASGRLLVKPGKKAASRVPVYGAAKPTSATTTAAQPNGGALVTTGAGIRTGGTSTTDYNSLLSVLELGATSPQLPSCTTGDYTDGCVLTGTDRAMDLQYVGAGATQGADGLLYFGISTYGDWPVVGSQSIPYVDIDVDGDDEADYEIVLQTVPATDLLYATTYDLNAAPGTDDVVDLQPVNFNDGNVDTNVFDTNTVVFGALKDSLAGLPTSGPIRYQVGTEGYYSTLDSTDWITFDANAPAVSTAGPILPDQGGTSIPLTGTGGARALVLHLHGASGARAQVLDVPAAPVS